jgi:hypothetical protein
MAPVDLKAAYATREQGVLKRAKKPEPLRIEILLHVQVGGALGDPSNSMTTTLHAEFGEDVTDVHLDRSLRKIESTSDGSVAQASGDKS